MAQQLFANNAFSSLASTITNVATSITLATGHGARFPAPTGGDHFLATLVGIDSNGNENAWEIIKVTTRSADVLTVVRGQEGSTALPWAAGSRIELRATSGTFGGLLQLTGGTITGPITMTNGATTAFKVGVTGLVSVGGEAGSADSRFTITNGGAVGLEFSQTAIANQNRILSYNRLGAAFVPLSLAASEVRFNISGTDTLTANASGLTYTGTLTGGTGVVNLGSGQVYKTADGKVGIGTASPTSKFVVAGEAGGQELNFGYSSGLAANYVQSIQRPSGAAVDFVHYIDGLAGFRWHCGAGATEKMRLDSAGNLGLGVTPSAWGFGGNIELAATNNIAFAGSGNFLSNAYYSVGSGSYIYKTSAGANRHQMSSDGSFAWFTAPSGTAGNPITFTTAMELGSSGNLTLRAGYFNFTDAAGAAQINNYRSGDIEIVQRTAGYGVSFYVGAGSYAGRFDPNGNLLVGTTSPDGKINVVNSSATQWTANLFNQSTTAGTRGLSIGLATNNDATGKFIECGDSGAFRMRVLGNGNLQNSNNSYGAISDLKLKENITDASPKLAKLMQVRIVNYTLKSDPDKTKLIGVVAQELEQINPGLVEETPDYEEVKKTREVEVPAVDAVLDDEGNEVTPAVEATTRTEEYTERVALGTVTKSVKYSVFVPMLIKGMQEQQAQIEAMQARLEALEAA